MDCIVNKSLINMNILIKNVSPCIQSIKEQQCEQVFGYVNIQFISLNKAPYFSSFC